jgi:hypothetical protein
LIGDDGLFAERARTAVVIENELQANEHENEIVMQNNNNNNKTTHVDVNKLKTNGASL